MTPPMHLFTGGAWASRDAGPRQGAGLHVLEGGQWRTVGEPDTGGPTIIDPTTTAFGAPVAGGYFVGVIDTTRGNIDPKDSYQEGARYALIRHPEPPSVGTLKTANVNDPPGMQTRWDGLAATRARAESPALWPACARVLALPHPADGGSPWYIPAIDEAQLIALNNSEGMRTSTRSLTGDTPPPTSWNGVANPSADPPTRTAPTTTVASMNPLEGVRVISTITERHTIQVWEITPGSLYIGVRQKTLEPTILVRRVPLPPAE